MSINLLEFFKNVEDENYCIIKSFKLDYTQGSDIDIFCFDIKSFSNKLLMVANQYVSKGYIVKINDSRETHWHIDLIKDNKIEIRFDLYNSMPQYKNILIKDALFSSIVENRFFETIDEVKIYKQSLIDELLLRYIEYIEYYKLRPDKVKHLDFILKKIENDEDNKLFLDKLHYYTKLPQVLEVGKKNDLSMILSEIKTKLQQTPLKELPKKTIKFIKRRVGK